MNLLWDQRAVRLTVFSMQSVEVSQFEGYRSSNTSENISPLRRGANASEITGENPIYSCEGGVQIAWNTSGLVDEVEIRVSSWNHILSSLMEFCQQQKTASKDSYTRHDFASFSGIAQPRAYSRGRTSTSV